MITIVSMVLERVVCAEDQGQTNPELASTTGPLHSFGHKCSVSNQTSSNTNGQCGCGEGTEGGL